MQPRPWPTACLSPLVLAEWWWFLTRGIKRLVSWASQPLRPVVGSLGNNKRPESALQAPCSRAGKLRIPRQRHSLQWWYQGPSMMMCQTPFLFFKLGVTNLQLKHTARWISWIGEEWLKAGYASSAWERDNIAGYKRSIKSCSAQWRVGKNRLFQVSIRGPEPVVNKWTYSDPCPKQRKRWVVERKKSNSLKLLRSTLTFLLRGHIFHLL